METSIARSLTPNLPEYSRARHFVRILEGKPFSLYREMYNSIWDQRGSPQETVDWSDPEAWIPSRLSGAKRELALTIWRQSSGGLNPRYLRGSWYLCSRHELLTKGQDGNLTITIKGNDFLQHTNGQVVAEIDEFEGILTALRLVAERGPGKRSEFLSDFAEFCRAYTNYQKDSPIKSALYDRLMNLIDRDLISRSEQTYSITDGGLSHLERYASRIPGQTRQEHSKLTNLRKLAQDLRREARGQLEAQLLEMNPFKFEELISHLLEEMGYSDVVTTSRTGDKGVDVVANIQLGISSVREVVQVKRHKANLNRTVLDQLRGSLHRFNAVRGTIITIGGFSKGTQDAAFEPGAAPITLIDGSKLIDLLVEYEIGVRKLNVDYLEFNPQALEQFDVTTSNDLEIE